MSMALRGTAFIYHGQELGLPDADIPPDRIVDVDGRDPERAPMPWQRPSQAGPGAGFTTGKPWLPVPADAERLCVEAQQNDPASMLTFVRRVLRIRLREPALQSGTQRLVEAAPDVFCFERQHLGRRFLVALNFTSLSLPLGLREEAGGPAEVILSTSPGRDLGAVQPRDLVLEPDEGLILRLPAR